MLGPHVYICMRKKLTNICVVVDNRVLIPAFIAMPCLRLSGPVIWVVSAVANWVMAKRKDWLTGSFESGVLKK